LLSAALVGAFFAAPVLAAPPTAGGFLENIGQWDEAVLFRTEVAHTSVYCTASGLVFDIVETNQQTMADADASAASAGRSRLPAPMLRRGCAVNIRFAGANPAPRIQASGELPGRYHFFLGSDPSAWRSGARRFADVVYRDVWPGIDLALHVAPASVEYDVVYHPGAAQIRVALEFEGADRVLEQSDGVQRIETAVGTLVHVPPAAGETSGRIVCGDAHGSRVDPRSMSTDWITFVGGSGWDGCWANASDDLGRPVVCGATNSPDLPATPGAYQDSLAGDFDAFVAKLSADGETLLWATYLGGSLFERADDVTLDAAGNVLTIGQTVSADFPTTAGAFDTTPSAALSDTDGFVTKLSPDGDALVWSTLLGGELDEIPWSMTLDLQENVVVTGDTQSENFPTTGGAYDETHNGGYDVFVTKLANLGDDLVWSTLLGATADDAGWNVALDAQEHPVVVGHTLSSSFPTTGGAFQETYQGGDYDGYLAMFSAGGDALLCSTFLGGGNQDVATGVRITAAGNLAVGVRTKSIGFPTTPGAYDRSFNGGIDFAILEMDPVASTLHWSTLVGGSSNEWISNLEIGPGGSLVTAGTTYSTNFPTTPDAFDRTYNLNGDGFVIMVSATGAALLYGSFYGGSGVPAADPPEGFITGNPVTVAPDGDIFVSGGSWSADFPTTMGAWDTTFDGGADGVLLRIHTPATDVPHVAAGNASGLHLACSPNPFRHATAIHYSLPAAAPVKVSLYSASGRLVRSLEVSDLVSAGAHELTWDGRNGDGLRVAAGVYLCRVEAIDQEVSQPVVLLR
jgi:hypothetical protein